MHLAAQTAAAAQMKPLNSLQRALVGFAANLPETSGQKSRRHILPASRRDRDSRRQAPPITFTPPGPMRKSKSEISFKAIKRVPIANVIRLARDGESGDPVARCGRLADGLVAVQIIVVRRTAPKGLCSNAFDRVDLHRPLSNGSVPSRCPGGRQTQTIDSLAPCWVQNPLREWLVRNGLPTGLAATLLLLVAIGTIVSCSHSCTRVRRTSGRRDPTRAGRIWPGLSIPAIAISRSRRSRSPIPNDRDQCGAGV